MIACAKTLETNPIPLLLRKAAPLMSMVMIRKRIKTTQTINELVYCA